MSLAKALLEVQKQMPAIELKTWNNRVYRRSASSERFARFVDDAGECWLWTGAINENGYGRFKESEGSNHQAHRFAYTLFVGQIPAGHHIDHLCGVRACVNPDHLEAVTPAENNRRSVSPSAINAQKTHCVNGHEFTEANTYRVTGRRQCRACKRRIDQRRRAA